MDSQSLVWGIIGIVIAILSIGIPVGYGIKALLKQILDLLQTVKSLIESVQYTVVNVNSTVDKMALFIDRNEQQHAAIEHARDAGFDRVTDNINNQSNRICDNISRKE